MTRTSRPRAATASTPAGVDATVNKRTISHVTDVIIPPKPFDTDRDHFSFSQLSMYLRCSMQYYFRYILGLKERPNLDLARGRAGHTSLEMNARHKVQTKSDQSVEQILDNFSTTFDAEVADLEPGDIEPGRKPGDTKDQTVEALRLWRLRDAAKITPHAVELEFLIPLPPTEDHHDEIKPINGKIDLINTRPIVMVPRARPVLKTNVVDEKFPARKPSNALEQALMSDQLTLYDLVLARAGKPVDALGLEHFIPPTKTLPARVEVSWRAREAMKPAARKARHERLLYKLRTVARAIRAGIFVPTDDPKDCSWCGFRERCQFSLVKSDYDAMMIRSKTPR